MNHLPTYAVERIHTLLGDLRQNGASRLDRERLAEIENLVKPIPIPRRLPDNIHNSFSTASSGNGNSFLSGSDNTHQLLLQRAGINMAVRTSSPYLLASCLQSSQGYSADSSSDFPSFTSHHGNGDASFLGTEHLSGIGAGLATNFPRPASYAGGEFHEADLSFDLDGPPSLPPDWSDYGSPSNAILFSAGPSPILAPVPESCPSMDSGPTGIDFSPLTRANSQRGSSLGPGPVFALNSTFPPMGFPGRLGGCNLTSSDFQLDGAAHWALPREHPEELLTLHLDSDTETTIALPTDKSTAPIPIAASGPHSSRRITFEDARIDDEDSAEPATSSGRRRARPVRQTCEICRSQFRGIHELRRHMDTMHGGKVTRYQCQNPQNAGIPFNFKPAVPLSKCNACRAGKTYKANYNAAAHLRRIHFKPRQPRNRNGELTEKRGGQGGGDWPPMQDLAHIWFREVSVSVNSPTESTEDAEGEAVPGIDNTALEADSAIPDLDSTVFPLDEELDESAHIFHDDMGDLDFALNGFVSPHDYLSRN